MIRRSTVIAIAAILLSLFVHFIGLGFTPRVQPNRSAGDTPADAVEMGNAFEDVADVLSEPVLPEPAVVPDPPAEKLPEPELPEMPTSEALVASADPQRVATPDTGSAKVAQPDLTEPSEPEDVSGPEPEIINPSGGDEKTTVEAAVSPSVELDTIAEAPEGTPDGPAEPVEAVAAEPVPGKPIAPVPQQLAALPAPTTPSVPVTPVPESSAVPVIPLERETVDPENEKPTVEAAPEGSEKAEVEGESDFSELAVNLSQRPQLPSRRPSAEPAGLPGGSSALSIAQPAPSQLIESPLTAYQRDGTDLTIGRSGGARSGGNSDVNNYAGQVLVHLNRAPDIRVLARGYARVMFEINPDGSLAWVDIIDSTGSREIERAAKAQVRSAAPFPRPPKGASRKLAFFYQSD